MSLQCSCPCGTGSTSDACCGRLHRGAAQAQSAEELMRSRHAAHAVGDLDHAPHIRQGRTRHPRTRPADLEPDPTLVRTGLQVLDATEGEVAFVASFVPDGVPGRRRERSRSEPRGGRWVHVDGDLG